MFSELAQRERPVDSVIGQSDFLRQWHLALDAPDGVGAGEAVSFFQPGDLGFSIGGNDDGCIHSLVDAGLEQQRDVVDDDGLGIVLSGLSGETFLLSCNAWVDDALKHEAFGRLTKDDGAKRVAVKGAIRIEHALAERRDDFLPGRFAWFHNHTGQCIGIDDDGAALLEYPGYSAFPGSHAACESDQKHDADLIM